MPKVFDRVAIDRWGPDEIVQKFPQGGLGDIKLGSQLIVNPYEVAVFVRGGEPLGTFTSGRHTLTTENVPFLTDLLERGLFGGKNVFTADVYFVKAADMTMRWGTANPIVIEHPQRPPGASAIRGNGTYVVRVKEPWRFLQALDAFRDSVNQTWIKERLDPMLGVMIQDKLSELAVAKSLGPAQLQSFTKDLNDLLIGLLQQEFDAIGMTMQAFNIVLGLHPDSLTIVTKMGYGTTYTQMQQADAMVAAAQNASGSGLGELGIGAMGMAAMQQQQMLQQQQQMLQQQAAAAAQSTAATAAAMPDVMTPVQAAAILQVPEADVLAAITAGELKAKKIGSSYRISKASLEEYLAG